MKDLRTFAAGENVSTKTLQRQFVRETGIPFAAWRTRARLFVAAHHLREQRAVAWCARHVGFQTLSGFSRAFRHETGQSPRAYANHHRNATEAARSVDSRQQSSVQSAVRGLAPQVPARSSWTKVNDHHELMWMYRGTARVCIGPREVRLTQGQAMWMPAGVPHAADFASSSLLLTVGTAHGRVNAGVRDLLVFDLGAERELALLRAMISEFTILRAPTGSWTLVEQLFRQQFGAARTSASSVSGALGVMATAIRRDPRDSRSLADWARHLRTTTRRLGREIAGESGGDFVRWRASLRMDVAREMLQAGTTSSATADALGYASPSAFTRAFTNAHGVPPRMYLRATGRQR